ncbi:protein-glutamate methylesterase/protein-glutamine glutaminase [Legionella sp. CNM-4043-24]|uniref:protein-glutamate methylesterase/protein-glutamine glutaminase n=1 Tax=Legionella sp. CNM-4043-24 TaxID=3421646 RepID=UPI00403AF4E9
MIIDDSALMRRVISDMITRNSDMEVVGSLANARFAIAMVERLNPDIITLDIEMPEMDGLTALSELKKKYPALPVIMCSTQTRHGGQATLEALNRGAADYIAKPGGNHSRDELFEKMSHELTFKIRGLARQSSRNKPTTVQSVIRRLKAASDNDRIDILTIGVSTGGPNALTKLLPAIPANFPIPIVIVQHMPPVFTGLLAENLNSKSAIRVSEARHGDELQPGCALIAPGNYHMRVERQNMKHIVTLNQDEAENFCRPAADVLFRSVAAEFGSHSLAVVMTGMGKDGLLGCDDISKRGGQIIVQDEASSVVWGMPGEVATAGLAQEILPLETLSHAIIQRVNRKRVLL